MKTVDSPHLPNPHKRKGRKGYIDSLMIKDKKKYTNKGKGEQQGGGGGGGGGD